MSNDNDIESTRATAESRIRASVDGLVGITLVNDSLTSIDAIVYSSCGGDLQQLIAEQAIKSICLALGQNPVDLLEAAIKNSTKTSEG